MRNIIVYALLMLLVTACAKIERKVITIDTRPSGAKITVLEKNLTTGMVTRNEIGLSPAEYEIVLPKSYGNSSGYTDDTDNVDVSRPTVAVVDPKYTIKATKDGYFAEEDSIVDYDKVFKSSSVVLHLDKSPLWWATTESAATNQWVNLIVSSEISDVDMWSRIVDAVTKRFPDLKEYDYTSGYLVTVPKIKSYQTSRGTFLLRSKFFATVMERDPLTYRLKIDSEWSTMEGVEWNPYPRVFVEDAELIKELMSRFQAY